jgi:ABC-type glutathione transport system ATPase component
MEVLGLRVARRNGSRAKPRTSTERTGIQADDSLLGPISFELCAGERVALVGPSGAGKSLTLRAMLGLLPTELIAEGEISKALAPFRGRYMTLIPQDARASLSPVTRVGDQLEELRTLHGAARSAPNLISLAGLDEGVLRLHAHELSGGMAQRVCLALALACDPRVLLADEPCSALDGPSRHGFLEALERCCEEQGTALLFVSHDWASVARLCPRTMVMHQGRVLEDGSTATLLAAPQQEVTRTLVEAARRGGVPASVANHEPRAEAKS